MPCPRTEGVDSMVIAGKGIIVDTASHAIRLEDCCHIMAYSNRGRCFLLGEYWPEEYADFVFRDLQLKAIQGQAAYVLPDSNLM